MVQGQQPRAQGLISDAEDRNAPVKPDEDAQRLAAPFHGEAGCAPSGSSDPPGRPAHWPGAGPGAECYK